MIGTFFTRDTFLGRPDGLGNRLEEIVRLAALRQTTNRRYTYLWSNPAGQPERSYEIRFQTREVKVERLHPIKHPFAHRAKGKGSSKEYNRSLLDELNLRAPLPLATAATSITPSFEINFPAATPVIGIHIRGTDRVITSKAQEPIMKLAPEHFMTIEEHHHILTAAKKYINTLLPESVFICADTPHALANFIAGMDKRIRVETPRADPNVEQEYLDFFALAQCPVIVKAAKFSSFSLMAGLVGARKLVTFSPLSETTLKRYPVETEYVRG